MKISITSGGFDPQHLGHVRLFREARKLGDMLLVIINNDNWLIKKKGFAFLPENERLELIRELRSVSEAILTKHKFNDKDVSVCDSLKEIKELYPNDHLIFCNGGDRKQDNIPEYDLCNQLGIEMAFNVGGEKIQSSSELVKKAREYENSNKHIF